jgi:hypothetical protein
MQVAPVAVCSEINTQHANKVWADPTIFKIFNLFVHPVTSRLLRVNEAYVFETICYMPEVDDFESRWDH